MTETPSGGGSRLLRDDVVSGGVLLLVAAAYGAGAMRIPSQAGEPGPGFIPLALSVMLAALSVAIVVGGLQRSADTGGAHGADRADGADGAEGADRAEGAEDEPADAARRVPQSGGGRSRGVAMPSLAALATIAYAALFQPLGFVLSTLAYSGYLTSLFTEDRKLRAAVPVFVTLALFIFFRLALGVRLPTGLLGP